MTSDLYIQVLQHVQQQTLCSKDYPILIICDNHESHISIEAVNYCRNNGIVSPHTSYKLQSLDISDFEPFKGKIKIAFNAWHVRNIGKTLSTNNIAELSKSAFLEISKSGIWPFNRLASGGEDFAPIEIYSQSFQDEEMNQAIQSEEVDFVEVERDRNDETIDREEIQNDPLDNQRNFDRSANIGIISSFHHVH
ncbi:hypothetical protein HF086_000177 [Spodoptera exigua]|uniref:DDE-1 domain-containing protein n=1 Tax=Spodoptera exigua TaxID=7107 RepID=A0A922LZZ1_SPOEX|nr:hypothetical protein HF086_000177 [Spodoptera exigua]